MKLSIVASLLPLAVAVLGAPVDLAERTKALAAGNSFTCGSGKKLSFGDCNR